MQTLPILYSFRRCPYAMRARLAMWQSGLSFELREVVLRDKPQTMLDASPKGTVPVLVVNTEARFGPQHSTMVVDESLDIMLWALTERDPEAWMPSAPKALSGVLALIEQNDTEFKGWLDKYKYFDRFPEHPQVYYRQQGERFIEQLEAKLVKSPYLSGDRFGLLDAAIAPFIRQFAHVDLEWFEQSSYPKTIQWLSEFKESTLFKGIMKKYPAWKPENQALLINAEELKSEFK
ncbi:glutathione S-transferase [Litoribrevibacter euphylliae]|uniref:Glutathione S-transferase n=1 Tax=Litoribrevibacter euphylliae TaxID=1834034 RepID=A0ABV7HCN0_9GAMM